MLSALKEGVYIWMSMVHALLILSPSGRLLGLVWRCINIWRHKEESKRKLVEGSSTEHSSSISEVRSNLGAESCEKIANLEE